MWSTWMTTIYRMGRSWTNAGVSGAAVYMGKGEMCGVAVCTLAARGREISTTKQSLMLRNAGTSGAIGSTPVVNDHSMRPVMITTWTNVEVSGGRESTGGERTDSIPRRQSHFLPSNLHVVV